MKIIGNTHGEKLLVEMDPHELSQVLGYSSTYSATRELTSRFKPGYEFSVASSWSDLAKFRAAEEQIQKAAEVLRACASFAETASASYVIEPKVKDIEPTKNEPTN